MLLFYCYHPFELKQLHIIKLVSSLKRISAVQTLVTLLIPNSTIRIYIMGHILIQEKKAQIYD